MLSWIMEVTLHKLRDRFHITKHQVGGMDILLLQSWLVEYFRSHEDYRFALTHGDLRPPNIMVNEDNPSIITGYSVPKVWSYY